MKAPLAPQKAAPAVTALGPLLQRHPQLQRRCTCGGTCASCRKKKKPELQRRGLAAPAGSLATPRAAETRLAPAAVHNVLRSPGQPMDLGTRSSMEASFGHDFSKIRIHSGPRAAASAEAVQAEAYTVGRNVVFGAGRYAPASGVGKELLAHELAHTLQQGQTESLPQNLSIHRPGGSDEGEADRFARQALSNGGRGKPLFTVAPTLQRKVKAKVKESTKPTSKACLVHVHGDETSALKTAATLHAQRCTNFVYLEHDGTPDREVPVENKVNKRTYKCTVDPNRIFADSTVKSFAKSCAASAPKADQATVQTAFEKDIQGLREDIARAISRGRRGAGTADFAGPDPIVVFHNNTPGDEKPTKKRPFGGTSVSKYERISKALAAAKTPKAKQALLDKYGFQGDTSTLPRDSKNALTNPNNFVFATDRPKDKALTSDLNVVFQDPGLQGTSADDGSLSVALENERYINIEAQAQKKGKETKSQLATNLDMGNKVLDHLNVPPEPCAEPIKASYWPAVDIYLAFERMIDEENQRVAAQQATLATALPRDAAPPKKVQKKVEDGKCQIYDKKKDLDDRKTELAKPGGLIGSMKDDDLIRWIIGIDAPPKWVKTEVKQQTACLEIALRAAPGVKTPGGSVLHSHVRPLGTPGKKKGGGQSKIWQEKFEFSRGGQWDRITDKARKKCSALVRDDDKKWTKRPTKELDHCFKEILTDDERQREILQATAGPGVSRHHWGTDFDFPNQTPEDWEKGKTGKKGWADEHSWLQRNASTYGFVQPYTADSSFLGLGYIEERWHWSYYPIAQALQEWAALHKKDIGTALEKEVWSKAPASFSFIRKRWEEYFFNVNNKPRF